MGLLIDGKWQNTWYDTEKTKGQFVREPTKFHNQISQAEGSDFLAESGRYHLYVSYACPWAHRTIIMRELKDLTDHISMDVVHPHMLEYGWTFLTFGDVGGDQINDNDYLYQVYQTANAEYNGRVTVPVLWDKKTNTIVNNESSEIIRMFNTEFNSLTNNELDLYPENYREEIDKVNENIYDNINNGVYKCGFATSQQAYEEAFEKLFSTLKWCDTRLADQKYLVGDKLTEADIRLFTTLIRFDAVYYSHFKCNLKLIRDFKNLSRHTKTIYHYPKIADTVHFDHIKQHYYYSHITINPTQIVPVGPKLDFDITPE